MLLFIGIKHLPFNSFQQSNDCLCVFSKSSKSPSFSIQFFIALVHLQNTTMNALPSFSSWDFLSFTHSSYSSLHMALVSSVAPSSNGCVGLVNIVSMPPMINVFMGSPCTPPQCSAIFPLSSSHLCAYLALERSNSYPFNSSMLLASTFILFSIVNTRNACCTPSKLLALSIQLLSQPQFNSSLSWQQQKLIAATLSSWQHNSIHHCLDNSKNHDAPLLQTKRVDSTLPLFQPTQSTWQCDTIVIPTIIIPCQHILLTLLPFCFLDPMAIVTIATNHHEALICFLWSMQ